MDVLLTTENRKIDIEINAQPKPYLHTRNVAYQSNNYANYTLVGEMYKEEIEIIQINLSYGINDKKEVREYYIQDKEGKKYVRNYKIIEYNMDKLKEIWYSKDEAKIEEYKYLIMLDLKKKELEKLSKKDKVVKKFQMEVEILNNNPAYQFLTEEEDQRFRLNTEKYYARKEGLEEGLQEGIQKGMQKGMKEGLNKKAKETAKKLLDLGVNTIEQIAQATGLSIKEIEKLQNK